MADLDLRALRATAEAAIDAPTMVERVKALGEYDGPPDPGEIIRDVWKVAATLLRGQGMDYCACQMFPCECVMRFMDDLAECITERHPGSRADRPMGSEETR